MKVAVIGGGLFGCTAAIHASRAGHDVHLYEAKSDIMHGASGRCYYRLHRGYHYPRSPETGRESLKAEAAFRREFGSSVVDGGRQYYVIVENGGHVSGPDFGFFLDQMNLPYVRDCDHELIRGSEWIFEVTEPRLDVERLTGQLREKLDGVSVHLDTPMPDDIRDRFDAIVVAGYAETNMILMALGLPVQPYKFQLVEKPIVRLPSEFKDISIVVADGPFCCLDPHGSTDLHVLGHVVETVHHSNVGLCPEVPPMPVSRHKEVIAAVARFIPGVGKAEYVDSIFSVRAVLPDQEKTDARPTLVHRLDEQVIRVFSGKLGTAVAAAYEVTTMLRRMRVPRLAVAV